MRRRTSALAAAVAALAVAVATAPAAPAAPQAVVAQAPVGGPSDVAVDVSEVEEVEVVEAVDASGRVVAEAAHGATRRTACVTRSGERVCRSVRVLAPIPAPRRAAAAPAPAPSTAGMVAGRHYSFMSTDASKRPAHWDRCTPIRYRVNATGAPAGAAAEVHEAVRRLASASGLSFRHVGSSTVVPYNGGDWTRALDAEKADLVVAWATPTQVPQLAGGTAGLGGPVYQTVAGREPRIVKGAVVLDRTERIAAGFANGATRGALLMHELGHAVNLGHVSAKGQLMEPLLTPSHRAAYQSGDVAGLKALASYSCF